MDINNFIIDQVKMGIMYRTDNNDIMFSLTQITDPTLSITVDTPATAVDAMGTTIASFDRGKSAEFSGSNAIFDVNLLAAQSGTEKNVASATNLILVPMWETVTYTGEPTVILSKVPVGAAGAEIPFIWAFRGDSTMGTKFSIGATASDTEFTLSAATRTLTFPTDLDEGTELFVSYEYNSQSAIEVINTAIDFPDAGKFIVQVIGNDICSPTIKYVAYLVFPNAKLSAAVDIAFTTDGGHPFSMTMMQGYCDRQRKLFSLIIPEE